GVRLTEITQKLAYKYTRLRNATNPITITTSRNLMRIKDEVEDATKNRPTTELIWKSLKLIRTQRIADFFWRMIHGKIKCGSFFRHMPKWQDRQFCPCGQIEDIDHITLHCEKSGPRFMEYLSKIWVCLTKKPFQTPTYGTLMGIGTIQVDKKNGQSDATLTEIHHTMITLAAWTLWKTRNER
ncbi:hypothetical protein CPB84DRAFT_1637079, partial [Gymnopilus junonius]